MASFNKVILLGNLTRDPELRYTPKGLAIARIGLAVNRVFRSETGESREETTFVDVDAFGKQAETIGQYLKKGNPLFIEGRLRLDQWDDKQTGQKRSAMRVVVESFQFIGGASRGSEAPGAGAPMPRSEAPRPRNAAPQANASDDTDGGFPGDEDDVPF